jgi:nucleoside-diphosphate-sugar epimerase
MPIVPAPAKVLVTGANGFIANWVVRVLLEQGYSVRGTVRTSEKGKYLTEYFGKRGFGPDKLEMVVVNDIAKVTLPIFFSFSQVAKPN